MIITDLANNLGFNTVNIWLTHKDSLRRESTMEKHREPYIIHLWRWQNRRLWKYVALYSIKVSYDENSQVHAMLYTYQIN